MGILADGFQRRAKLTIPSAQVGSGGVSNYSIVLTEACIGSGHSFWSEVQSNGGDLRASTDVSGNTRLALDIIHLDTTAKTCEINVGQVSLSAVSANEFYLWWKHASAQSQPAVGAAFGQYATYESSMRIMQPLQSSVQDRTSNQLHGTRVGAGSDVFSTSQTGNGLVCDGGSSDVISMGTNKAVLQSQSMTWMLWIKIPSGGASRYLAGHYFYQAPDEQGLLLEVNASNQFVFWTKGGTRLINTSVTVGNNAWHMVAGVSQSGGNKLAYVDATIATVAANTIVYSATRHWSLGGAMDYPGIGNVWASPVCTLDNHRYWSRALVKAELDTIYNNTNSPGTFATLASADVLGGSNRRGFRTGGNLTAGGILIGGRL
jgi:hypothetical protein